MVVHSESPNFSTSPARRALSATVFMIVLVTSTRRPVSLIQAPEPIHHIHDEAVQQAGVVAGPLPRPRPRALIRRAFWPPAPWGSPSYNGRYGRHELSTPRSRASRETQDRIQLTKGLEGQKTTTSADAALQYPAGSYCALQAGKTEAGDARAALLMDKILLKFQFTLACLHPGLHDIVRHGQTW